MRGVRGGEGRRGRYCRVEEGNRKRKDSPKTLTQITPNCGFRSVQCSLKFEGDFLKDWGYTKCSVWFPARQWWRKNILVLNRILFQNTTSVNDSPLCRIVTSIWAILTPLLKPKDFKQSGLFIIIMYLST